MKVTALRRWGVTSAIVIACLSAPAAFGANDNGRTGPPVAPPDANYAGLSYGDWSAMWWQHIMSIPTSQNPMIDTTGANALVDQSGPVYFLAGTWGGSGEVTRTVTIPAGKALFFPIVNVIVDNGGCSATNVPPTTFTPAQMRAMIAGTLDSVEGLYASVDGAPIRGLQKYAVITPEFQYDLPATGNVWEFLGCGGYTFGDSWRGAVANGFYLMLRPLSPGQHVIRFGSSSMKITYKLTVAR